MPGFKPNSRRWATGSSGPIALTCGRPRPGCTTASAVSSSTLPPARGGEPTSPRRTPTTAPPDGHRRPVQRFRPVRSATGPDRGPLGARIATGRGAYGVVVFGGRTAAGPTGGGGRGTVLAMHGDEMTTARPGPAPATRA